MTTPLRRSSRLASIALVTTLTAPTLAHAQEFRWSRAVPAGSEVSISNINGNIAVTPSSSGQVEVIGVKRGSSAYFDRIKADVQVTSRGVTICVLYDDDTDCDDRGSHSRNNRGDRDWGNVRMDFQVAVPTNLLVSAAAVSGDVAVTGAHGDIRVSTVSGDIRMDKLQPTGIHATTVSGDVDVQIDEFTGAGDLSFNSVSGDITLAAPRGFEADLSMSTVSGDVNSDFPITLGTGRIGRRGVEARIGNGGRHFDVHTVSGNLRVRMAR